jgi:bacterioferritin
VSEPQKTPVTELLNTLLGIYWTGYVQHHTHVALVESWGVTGLATAMSARIADEPVTINALLNRLLDLDGVPSFHVAEPQFGSSLREVLDNDLAAQLQARPGLNEAAEAAGAAHDATTRILIEGILADEELHLTFLRTEVDLYERLGEALYVANRLGTAAAPPPP